MKIAPLVVALLATLAGLAAPAANAEAPAPKPAAEECPYTRWHDVERSNKTGFTGGRVMQITAALQVKWACGTGGNPDRPTNVRAYNAVDCEVNGVAHNCSFSNQLRHYVDFTVREQLDNSGTTGADGFWSRYSHWESVGRCIEYESRAETWNAGLAGQYSRDHFWTWSFNADGSAWSYCPT
jgi:hypothetical protein